MKEIHQNIGIENDMREYSFKERGRRRKETERVRGGAGCQEVVGPLWTCFLEIFVGHTGVKR